MPCLEHDVRIEPTREKPDVGPACSNHAFEHWHGSVIVRMPGASILGSSYLIR